MANGVTLVRASYPLTTPAVSTARLAVVAALRDHDAGPALVDAVALATSELGSNAVEAGHGTDFDVEVVYTPDPPRVVLRVTNAADLHQIPARARWRSSDPLAARGRGLSIVDTLADGFDFTMAGGRLVATATFHGRVGE